MSHWDTLGTLARDHHADLDREAARASLAAEAKAGRASAKTGSASMSSAWSRSVGWARERAARVSAAATRWATSER